MTDWKNPETNEPLVAVAVSELLGKATLRDQMAMAALTGLLSGNGWAQLDHEFMASEAYKQADAMMKARES
jgi:hypothetical protein